MLYNAEYTLNISITIVLVYSCLGMSFINSNQVKKIDEYRCARRMQSNTYRYACGVYTHISNTEKMDCILGY